MTKMRKLLSDADELFKMVTVCQDNKEEFNCYDCISKGFYVSDGNEKYDCLKGLAEYVMFYGPCYASSTYHFLTRSKLLEKMGKESLSILSIGCGFSPDYYGINKYVIDNNLGIKIKYQGIELNDTWEYFHKKNVFPNKSITIKNVFTEKIEDVGNYDIVLLDKFFSSLSENTGRPKFLRILKYYIDNCFTKDTVLIYKDVNDQHRGRTIFDDFVYPLFSLHETYKSGGYGFQYTSTYSTENIFTDIPEDISILPKDNVGKEVFFIYKIKNDVGGNP